MCYYQVIDGVTVHVNGHGKMDKETQDALEKLVKIARNYTWMKDKLKEDTNEDLEHKNIRNLPD